MSYNISDWKQKKLEDLWVPLSAFFRHERSDWHPEIVYGADDSVTLQCGCEQSIKGVVRLDMLNIQEIDMSGEGSGTFCEWILEPALKESSGEVEAVRIWEGGDSIDRFTVKNGVIKTTSVDL